MTEKPFDQEFADRLDAIQKEAAELGETWSSICREMGISRATPQRWRIEVPHTVAKMAEIESYLRSRRRELEESAVITKKII